MEERRGDRRGEGGQRKGEGTEGGGEGTEKRRGDRRGERGQRKGEGQKGERGQKGEGTGDPPLSCTMYTNMYMFIKLTKALEPKTFCTIVVSLML